MLKKLFFFKLLKVNLLNVKKVVYLKLINLLKIFTLKVKKAIIKLVKSKVVKLN